MSSKEDLVHDLIIAEEFIDFVRSALELNAEGSMSAADVVQEVHEMLDTYEERTRP
jgi:hypothetical protein